MKKNILKFAIAILFSGSLAIGCSSEKAAGSSSDSTKMDSTKMSTPATDSVKTDSVKKDTTHTPMR